jgi:hypothetical protein
MKIQNKLSLVLIASALAFLPACSTIVNGSNQLVKFNTGDVSEANCTITGGSDLAVNEKFTSPAELKIPRSKKALNVACSKDGYEDASTKVNSKIEGSTGGNLLFGGPVGVGVDALTGAIYKYPDNVTIPMTALDGTVDHTEE